MNEDESTAYYTIEYFNRDGEIMLKLDATMLHLDEEYFRRIGENIKAKSMIIRKHVVVLHTIL